MLHFDCHYGYSFAHTCLSVTLIHLYIQPSFRIPLLYSVYESFIGLLDIFELYSGNKPLFLLTYLMLSPKITMQLPLFVSLVSYIMWLIKLRRTTAIKFPLASKIELRLTCSSHLFYNFYRVWGY